MKIRVTMKDPDSLYDGTCDAVESLKIDGLSEEELEVVKEKRKEHISELASKWFEFGEYLTVEIDTELKTCVVVER